MAADLGLGGVEVAGEALPSSVVGARSVRLISISLRRAWAQVSRPILSTAIRRLCPAVAVVDLQDAAEALQYPLGTLHAPTSGIGEDHARWRVSGKETWVSGAAGLG